MSSGVEGPGGGNEQFQTPQSNRGLFALNSIRTAANKAVEYVRTKWIRPTHVQSANPVEEVVPKVEQISIPTTSVENVIAVLSGLTTREPQIGVIPNPHYADGAVEMASYPAMEIAGRQVTLSVGRGSLMEAPVEAIVVPTQADFSSDGGGLEGQLDMETDGSVYEAAHAFLDSQEAQTKGYDATKGFPMGTAKAFDSGLSERGIKSVIFVNEKSGLGYENYKRDTTVDEIALCVANALAEADGEGILSIGFPVIAVSASGYHGPTRDASMAAFIRGIALFKEQQEAAGKNTSIQHIMLFLRGISPQGGVGLMNDVFTSLRQ